MSTDYHAVFPSGTAANAAEVESRFASLDTGIGVAWTRGDDALSIAVTNNAELVAARSPYLSLDARLDALVLAGGNVATKANGVSAAGQKVLTVDATTGFIVGAYVVYPLNGSATLQGNIIASINAGVSLVLTDNIGATPAGGVLDDSYISMISISEYLAAQAIPHAGTLMLPDTIEYVNSGVRHCEALGASPSASAAVNTAAINAALADGGVVEIGPGDFNIATALTIPNKCIFRGAGIDKTRLMTDQAITMIQTAGYLGTTDTYEISIRDMQIDGGNAATLGIGWGAAGVLNYRNSIRDVLITGCNAGIVSYRSTYSSLDNVWIHAKPSATGIGFYIDDSQDIEMTGVVVSGFAINYSLYGATGIIATHCVSYWDAANANATALLKIRDSYMNTFRDCVFENLITVATSEVLIIQDDINPFGWRTHYNRFLQCRWVGTGSSLSRIGIGHAGGERVNGTVFRDCTFLRNASPSTDFLFTLSGYTTMDNCWSNSGYSGFTGVLPILSGVDLNQGTPVTAICTATEQISGMHGIHTTVLTLNITGANDLDLADGAGHGTGVKIFTFPALGAMQLLGAYAEWVTAVTGAAGGSQTIVMSVGTSTAADDDQLTGTEANIIPQQAVANGASTLYSVLPASITLDGLLGTISLYVNTAVADVNSSSDVTVAITGTLTLYWLSLTPAIP